MATEGHGAVPSPSPALTEEKGTKAQEGGKVTRDRASQGIPTPALSET